MRNNIRRFTALLGRETLLYSKDPSAPLLLIIAPAAFVVLMGHALQKLYIDRGHPSISVAVGFAVMFSFFGLSYIGWGFYREKIHGTWRRLESHGLPRMVIVVAKVVPVIVIILVQVILLVLIGGLVLELPGRISWTGVLITILALGILQAGLALGLLSLTRTPQSFNQLSQFFVLLGGTIGGALIPLADLPGWAQPMGRILPQHWALQGMSRAFEGAPMSSWIGPAGLLVLIGLVVGALGLATLDWEKLRAA